MRSGPRSIPGPTRWELSRKVVKNSSGKSGTRSDRPPHAPPESKSLMALLQAARLFGIGSLPPSGGGAHQDGTITEIWIPQKNYRPGNTSLSLCGGCPRGGEAVVASARIDWRRILKDSSTADLRVEEPDDSSPARYFVSVSPKSVKFLPGQPEEIPLPAQKEAHIMETEILGISNPGGVRLEKTTSLRNIESRSDLRHEKTAGLRNIESRSDLRHEKTAGLRMEAR